MKLSVRSKKNKDINTPTSETKQREKVGSTLDIVPCDCDPKTLALLHILALGNQQIENRKKISAKAAFKHIRKR